MFTIDKVLLSVILKILVALSLVILNGFFVAAEFSLVKVRKTRLAELASSGSKSATVALDVTSQLDAYLSACQLGITLASLGLGWLGEPTVAKIIEPLFAEVANWSSALTHTVSAVIAFLLITFLHIVLGELVPKSLAIQKAEAISLYTAGLLKIFYKLFYPAIWLLNTLANIFLALWGIKPSNEADLAHTEEELRMLVEVSQRHGHLDKMEGALLDNVFEFSDRTANEVMVPRQDMICLYVHNSIDEAVKTVKEYGHTRYPLCENDKDNVVGLIHMRDLLKVDSVKSLFELKRGILLIPENMPISYVVQKMRSKRTHMAIVGDEFGGTAGLVTIEDLVEELVGEIYDEFDPEETDIVQVDENEYEVNGKVLLEVLTDILEVELEDEHIHTIGGFIFSRIARKPEKDDEVDFRGFNFKVLEVKGPRITKVLVSKKVNCGGRK